MSVPSGQLDFEIYAAAIPRRQHIVRDCMDKVIELLITEAELLVVISEADCKRNFRPGHNRHP